MIATAETRLTLIDQARNALAKAVLIDEVKDIRDKAEALRLYAKQSGDTLEMQNRCAEIKMRAERRAGEILREMKANGQRHPGGRQIESHDDTQTLEDMGISKTQSSRWQKLASIPERRFDEFVSDTKGRKEELTSKGAQRLAVNPRPKVPNGKKSSNTNGHARTKPAPLPIPERETPATTEQLSLPDAISEMNTSFEEFIERLQSLWPLDSMDIFWPKLEKLVVQGKNQNGLKAIA